MNNQKVYTYGQSQGQASYTSPNAYNQKGPRVQGGGDRYDNYGGQNYDYGEEKSGCSGCEKCCACIAALICCCCIAEKVL